MKTLFCKEDGSWWWIENRLPKKDGNNLRQWLRSIDQMRTTATPIAREDWEKVKELIADIFEIPLTERWNPTPLKLYELDVELEVHKVSKSLGTTEYEKVAHLVEPKQTMKEKEELETEDEKASGTKGAIYLHGYYTAKDAIEIFKLESSSEQSVTKELRSVRVDLFSPCEKAILNAQYELEKVGASEGLTKAAMLLSGARQLVTDYLWTTKK